jgi:hypothetical protein
MILILDIEAYRLALRYADAGQYVIAIYISKSVWAVIMSKFKRQDVQCVNIKAEQLAGLSQTLFEYHDKLDHFQLKTLCALVYDLASDIHD